MAKKNNKAQQDEQEPNLEDELNSIPEPALEDEKEDEQLADDGAPLVPENSGQNEGPQLQSDNEIEIDNQVETNEVAAIVHPKIIGGVCEACGMDEGGKGKSRLFGYPDDKRKHKMDYSKYGNCKHYKGEQITCSYCNGDPEVLVRRRLNVFSLPESPKKLIIVCDDYGCVNRHTKRFLRKSN